VYVVQGLDRRLDVTYITDYQLLYLDYLACTVHDCTVMSLAKDPRFFRPCLPLSSAQ
jgi:hypothetical protein